MKFTRQTTISQKPSNQNRIGYQVKKPELITNRFFILFDQIKRDWETNVGPNSGQYINGPQGTEAHNKQSSSKNKGVEASEIAEQVRRSRSRLTIKKGEET